MQAPPAVRTTNMFSSLAGSTTPTSSTPSSSFGSEAQQLKKRSKKKKKSKSSSSSAKVDEAVHEQVADASQLPLAQRLEVAAGIPDVHAALIGLLGWSRMYARTETVLAFFQCDALALLLSNVLRSRPKADVVYDNLTALLANCLAVEVKEDGGDPGREVAEAVVAAVRAAVRSLNSNDLSGSEENDADADGQEPQSIEKATAEYLSRMVLDYSRSLRGVDAGSERAHKEMLALETKIAANAQRDRAVQGQGIRDNFERRDLRSDALVLLEKRLDAVDKLVATKMTSSPGVDAVNNGASPSNETGFEKFLVSSGNLSGGDNDDSANAGDDKEMAEVKQRLEALHLRKKDELAEALAKKQEADAALQTLKKQREALESQLRAVAAQIEDAAAHQQQIDEKVAAIEHKYSLERDAFDAQHQHVIRAYERRQRRQEITMHVDRAATVVREVSLARSGIEMLKHKQTSCRAQHLEAVVNYFTSELPCVKFMTARATQTEEELRKLESEIEGYRALGVSSVTKELTTKAETLQTHLDEDKQTLIALRKRDNEIVGAVNKRVETAPTEELDEKLIVEVRRHLDYVKKLYDECSVLNSENRKAGASASNGSKAASGKSGKTASSTNAAVIG